MRLKKTTRELILSGLLIAIGVVLPIVFHAIPDGGKIFSPMAIPIIIAALLLPLRYSVSVAIITPFLSSVLTGMPPIVPMPMAFMMAADFAVLSVVLWALVQRKKTEVKLPKLLISLVIAILIGQIVAGGVLWLVIQFFSAKGPGIIAYITGALITGLPGIAIQMVLIPILYFTLLPRLRHNAE